MYDGQSLSHTKWECKYHIVWIPKYRKNAIFRDLAKQKKCKVVKGHLMPDHVHILISIPPKHSVSRVVGFIKGKSAIKIARNFQGRKNSIIAGNSENKRLEKKHKEKGISINLKKLTIH